MRSSLATNSIDHAGNDAGRIGSAARVWRRRIRMIRNRRDSVRSAEIRVLFLRGAGLYQKRGDTVTLLGETGSYYKVQFGDDRRIRREGST